MKIRCQGCNRKISIDEAFAGGVCRCPYCKQINFVGGGPAGSQVQARPDAPSVRPDAPPPAGATLSDDSQDQPLPEYVPVAEPVKLQGIVTLVLLAAMLAMIGGAIYLLAFYDRSPGPDDPDAVAADTQPVESDYKNPLTATDGANVLSLAIAPPVVYCLDGRTEAEAFDYARVIVMESVKTLSAGGKFNILVLNGVDGRGEPFLKPAGFAAAPGSIVPGEVLKYWDARLPSGEADLAGQLARVLDERPGVKTIVLLGNNEVDEATAVAQRAARAGVRIVTVGITDSQDVAASMKKLAETTGGESRSYRRGELDGWLE